MSLSNTTTHQTLGHELASAVARTVPPVAVYSLTLNAWLAIASILYVVLQAAYLIWRWRTQALSRAEDKAAIAMFMKGPVAKVGDKAPRDR